MTLIQRWTIGNGGFIGEVSLYTMSEWDVHIKGADPRKYVMLSNLHIHPLRRGRGWARVLVAAALAHAQRQGWCVYLRPVPYNKPPMDTAELTKFYRCCGFRNSKREKGVMVLRW